MVKEAFQQYFKVRTVLISFKVRKKDDGMIYAMKCLKKGQIKRENKVRHVMNERQVL